METSPWEIRVLTEGARGEMDETPATIAVEAEETVNLLAGSEATTKAKTSTLTGQDREGTSTSIWRINLYTNRSQSQRTAFWSSTRAQCLPRLRRRRRRSIRIRRGRNARRPQPVP